jgi:hypothetical protein
MIVLRLLFGLLFISSVSAGNPYVVFKENGKSGVKTQEGKVLIPAKYDAIGWSNGSFSLINNVTGFRDGAAWGLINLSNQRITKNEFTDIRPADGPYIIATKRQKASPHVLVGCITSAGKQVIPFLYDGITISSLRAIVYTRIGNQFRYGLIDLENKTLIPQQYQDIKSIGTLRYAVRNFEGKIAVFSENGEQVTGFVIDSLSAFRNNLALIYQGKYLGVVNRDGKVQLEAKYRDILRESDAEVKVREPNEWSFLTSENKAKIKVSADSVVVLANGLYKISTSNQAQLVNSELIPVTEAVLTDIEEFQNGKATYKLGSFYGVIQKDGRVVVPALYSKIRLHKNYILAQQKLGNQNTWILFDSLGNRKITRAYQFMRPLRDDIFEVQHHGFFGIIDLTGKEIVACAYDSLLDFVDDRLVVKFKRLYGVISLSEEWVVAPRQNRITLMEENKYVEHAPGSSVLKERNGNVVYFTSNRIQIYRDHLIEYLPSGTIWKIDLNGTIADRAVAPAEMTEEIYEESEGYRAIKRNGKFGFIDSRGRLRIANRYEAVQPFHEGLAAVKILGKWGFINLQDNIAVQPVYDEVQSFQNGFALVRLKGLNGLIDKRGKLVLPVRYESIDVLSTRNLLIKINGLFGLSDPTGKVLIQPRYESLSDVGNASAIAMREKKYGVVNYNGVTTIPLMYDYIAYDQFSKLFMAMRESLWQTIILK